MGKISHLAEEISKGLKKACPWQRKTQREKLSLAIAGFLESGMSNTMETASILPLSTERIDMRYQWLSRLLANPHVVPAEIMRPFAEQMMKQISEKILDIVIGQTTISDVHTVLMVSLKWGNRGLPLVWKVKQGKQNLGFNEQK